MGHRSILQLSIVCLALPLFVLAPACRSSKEGKSEKSEKVDKKAEKKAAKEKASQERQAEIKASIPSDSKLAKLEFGMSEAEVGALLGAPDSQGTHTTGKQFIPFNFSQKDTLRTVYYYKGLGRVEFSAGSWGQRNGVVNMEHDPAEPGHKP